jgi:hypothetical protein
VSGAAPILFAIMRMRLVVSRGVLVLLAGVACHRTQRPAPPPSLADVVRQVSRFTAQGRRVVAITYVTAQHDTAAMRAEAARLVVEAATRMRSRTLLLVPCRSQAECDAPASLTAPVSFLFDCTPDASCRPAEALEGVDRVRR